MYYFTGKPLGFTSFHIQEAAMEILTAYVTYS